MHKINPMQELAPVTLSLFAMATRFELVLYGEDQLHLRSAGEEALEEIERCDAQLSYYRPDSEISWINHHAAKYPIKVEPRLFTLFKQCRALHELTDGAFDLTIAPLMRAWHFIRDHGGVPTADDLESARNKTGMHYLELDDEASTIYFRHAGMEIDLGGFGKGYAIGRAIDLLKENGVSCALLQGGTSSIATIGCPPGQKFWQVELREPFHDEFIPRIKLVDTCLSLSAIHGKSFIAEGKRFGHIINPQTGEPVAKTLAAAVTGTDAAVCEALSKALMIHSSSWLTTMEARFPQYQCLMAGADDKLYGNIKN
jgi:thiamine biosynthesis lipoprotein